MKKIINIVGLVSFIALIICVMTVSASAAEASKSEEDWDVVESFDNANDAKKNFDFYFFSDASQSNARRADKLEYSWKVEDGAVTRVGNIDTLKDNNVNIAIMTYVAEEYKNFELSVNFRMGTLTNYWPVVAVRQEIPGQYHLKSGTGLFMNVDGKINAWGPITSGRQEIDIPDKEEYAARDWHNMRIHAVGDTLTIYIDDVEATTMKVSDTSYAKGYISLISVNNDCSFDDFKIKSLDDEQANVKGNEPNKSEYAGLGQDLDDIIENGYGGEKAKEVKTVAEAEESREVKQTAPAENTVDLNTADNNAVEVRTVKPAVGVLVEKHSLDPQQKMLVKTFDERKRIFA